MIETLKKYCPGFIVENDLLINVFSAIAGKLDEIKSAILDLKNAAWTGEGLKLSLAENGILINSDKTENDKQLRLSVQFDVNNNRGTEAGISDDIQNLLNEAGTVNFFNTGECGIILNNTYPGIDQHAFLDARKVIKVNYSSAEDYSETIKEEIIPIDITLLI